MHFDIVPSISKCKKKCKSLYKSNNAIFWCVIHFTKDIAIKEKYARSVFRSEWIVSSISMKNPPLMKKSIKIRYMRYCVKNSVLMTSNTHLRAAVRESTKNVNTRNTLRTLHENGRSLESATDHVPSSPSFSPTPSITSCCTRRKIAECRVPRHSYPQLSPP